MGGAVRWLSAGCWLGVCCLVLAWCWVDLVGCPFGAGVVVSLVLAWCWLGCPFGAGWVWVVLEILDFEHMKIFTC